MSQQLLKAIQSQNAAEVNELLNTGADANAIDKVFGMPAIVIAAKTTLEIVQLLVDHGASLNNTDSQGETALTWARAKGKKDILEYLIGKGADSTITGKKFPPPESPIFDIILSNDIEALRVFLQATPTNLNEIRNKNKCTALEVAVYSGSPEIIQVLIDFGADVELRNNADGNIKEESLLHKALDRFSGLKTIGKRELDIIAILSSNKNLINATTRYEATGLNYVTDLSLAKTLLDHGANPNGAGSASNAPLSSACRYGTIELINLLLDYGADPTRIASKDTGTILHQIAILPAHRSDAAEMAKIMLHKGVDVHLKIESLSSGSNGKTALDLAKENKNAELVKVLTDYERRVIKLQQQESEAFSKLKLEELQAHFSYLAHTVEEKGLLATILKEAKGITEEQGSLIITFSSGSLIATPPADLVMYADWPQAFQNLIINHEHIWFPEIGHALCLGDPGNFDKTFIVDSVIRESKVLCPMGDFSDWWIYHPCEKKQNGNTSICFVSHDNGVTTTVEDDRIESVFLKRLYRLIIQSR
jgi:ankyrin repeat protein